MLRLDVQVPSHWTWKPGQHVFLRFPNLNILENHPFTIASLPQPSDKPYSSQAMTFIAREHGGVTRKLFAHVRATQDGDFSTVVDGPYGSHHRQYEKVADEVILVAGGNGITALLPWLLHLRRAMDGSACKTKTVKLIWAIRRSEHMDWIKDDLLRAFSDAPTDAISADIYITNERAKDVLAGKDSKELAVGSEVETASDNRSHSDCLLTKHDVGRPNLLTLLPLVVNGTTTAILGCGPEALKIDLSNAAAALQSRVFRKQAKEVMLYTESFDW
jgi:ferredoxin-NADP reductase